MAVAQSFVIQLGMRVGFHWSTAKEALAAADHCDIPFISGPIHGSVFLKDDFIKVLEDVWPQRKGLIVDHFCDVLRFPARFIYVSDDWKVTFSLSR